MSKKFKIIFDTSALYTDDDKIDKIFNRRLSDANKFIKKYDLNTDVLLNVPQMVVDERIVQRLQQLKNTVTEHNKTLNQLQGINMRKSVKDVRFQHKSIQKFLDKSAKEQIKKCNAKIISNCKIDQDTLSSRALNKIKPFSTKLKGDDGFKDTIIWLSILEDAKKSKNYNYIFYVENSNDFNKEICGNEFNKYSKKKFFIVNSLPELEEVLDKEYILNLELEKQNKIVVNEVMNQSGYITFKANNFLNEKNTGSYMGATLREYAVISTESLLGRKEDETTNINYSKMVFNNIFKVTDEEFNVNLTLYGKKVTDDGIDGFGTVMPYSFSMANKSEIVLSINLSIDLKTKKVHIHNIDKDYEYGYGQ